MKLFDYLLVVVFFPTLTLMYFHRKLSSSVNCKFPNFGIVSSIPLCMIWMLFLVWVVSKIGLLAIGR